MTSRYRFILPEHYSKKQFLNEKGVIFAIWHNRLTFGPRIFKGQKDTLALISPHSDGKIISNIVQNFGFGIIEGSTNKDAVSALKKIIHKISSGSNIVITPDGPRGPIYKINSNITQIAKKYNAKLIPISCNSTKYLSLNSWDNLIMPLPFGTIRIIIGAPLKLSEDSEQNSYFLEQSLNDLSNRKY